MSTPSLEIVALGAILESDVPLPLTNYDGPIEIQGPVSPSTPRELPDTHSRALELNRSNVAAPDPFLPQLISLGAGGIVAGINGPARAHQRDMSFARHTIIGELAQPRFALQVMGEKGDRAVSQVADQVMGGENEKCTHVVSGSNSLIYLLL
jgi:hypothetical protein